MMNNRKYWLLLSRAQGVSTHHILNLVERSGSPESLCTALREGNLQAHDVDTAMADRLRAGLDSTDVELELEALEKQGLRFITYEESEYPANLRQIFDPPLVLYIKGAIVPEDSVSVAIVGSRKASNYGKGVAQNLARELAGLDITVVSGLARGIDSHAHKGALEGNGRTIAVLGCGIDIVYPPENRSLKERIEDTGAVISEFPPGTEPFKYNFPARNRIIAGMTLGTVVVEAGLKSGALITAEFALESGREVFAVPGDILRENSRGPHRLIKEGAQLVEGCDDILSALKLNRARPVAKEANLSDEERKILNCLKDGAKQAAVIVDEVGLPSQLALAQISMMELRGLIRRGPGNLYSRV